ncbi:MAG: c-type cytochrome [Marinoscillum sp.]|uniref:c-type cytochrome n=1 Tax=Marinoscillum sp. TaxID=2024838 RepID=UPI0032FAEA86
MEIRAIWKLLSALMTVLVILVILTFGGVCVYCYNPSLLSATKVEPRLWSPPSLEKDLPEEQKGRMVRYGYALVTASSKWMGPMLKNPELRFAGNNLACKNCHLDMGRKPGSASWVGVTNRFPQFRARENAMGTIEERINGCMERSMNGRKLPEDSRQMEAIVAYLKWLSADLPQEREGEFKGFPKLKLPEVAADPLIGEKIYTTECQLCHGANGEGTWLADSTKGYQYPPLWGPDSYNDGAGMHRIITAAEFIKGNMPYGEATRESPKLTDEEAYHVAAYINSFERPVKADREKDFPDRRLKPVSTSYGPWLDDFSAEQHKYGPFQPIMAYYKETYGITKTK